MIRKCLKCSHVNSQASGDELEGCPECGAIYSRVEAAWGARPVARPAAAAAPLDAEVSVEDFAERMRRSSLYPTFRNLVEVLHWVLLLLAAFVFVGGLLGAWQGQGAAAVGSFFFGLTFGLFFVVVARVSREMSLMLADLSDAAVRIASRARP